MKSSLQAMFSKNPLNRMEEIRGSIDDFLASPSSMQAVFILILNDELVVRDNGIDYLFSYAEISLMGIPSEPVTFLGAKQSMYYFAKSIDSTLGDQFNYMNLRTFATANLHEKADLGILAQAFSILKWHKTHLFCSACGAKNILMQAGWRQDCPGCAKQHFPRIDPVVIMLVTCGDYCLLGRGHDFQQQRYSCLAGFMEPGETIENAARRELFEEAGVIGLEVNYLLSQPWPFPFNLMIGVHVHTENMDLRIDYNELSDARWLNKMEVGAVLNGAEDLGITLPPQIAIARTLLDHWITT